MKTNQLMTHLRSINMRLNDLIVCNTDGSYDD